MDWAALPGTCCRSPPPTWHPRSCPRAHTGWSALSPRLSPALEPLPPPHSCTAFPDPCGSHGTLSPFPKFPAAPCTVLVSPYQAFPPPGENSVGLTCSFWFVLSAFLVCLSTEHQAGTRVPRGCLPGCVTVGMKWLQLRLEGPVPPWGPVQVGALPGGPAPLPRPLDPPLNLGALPTHLLNPLPLWTHPFLFSLPDPADELLAPHFPKTYVL